MARAVTPATSRWQRCNLACQEIEGAGTSCCFMEDTQRTNNGEKNAAFVGGSAARLRARADTSVFLLKEITEKERRDHRGPQRILCAAVRPRRWHSACHVTGRGSKEGGKEAPSSGCRLSGWRARVPRTSGTVPPINRKYRVSLAVGFR